MPRMYLTRVYHSPQRVSWPSSSAPGFGLPRHDGRGTRGPGEDAMERHGLAVPRPNLKRSGGSGKAELTPFPLTPFILMGAPSNHTNIPLICLVVFPILAVSGRCVHTAMVKGGVVAQDCFGYEDL